MVEAIRMNQIIQREEDPELYDFFAKFSKGKPYQARKLMLLGLVQLGQLNGHEPAVFGAIEMKAPNVAKTSQKDEFDLINEAGVAELF